MRESKTLKIIVYAMDVDLQTMPTFLQTGGNRISGSLFLNLHILRDDKAYLSFSTPNLILDLTVPSDKSSRSAIST